MDGCMDEYTLHSVEQDGHWWTVNCKGFRRNGSWSSPCIILVFSWRQENLVRIANVPAKIRTQHLPNSSVDRYRYTNLLGRQAANDRAGQPYEHQAPQVEPYGCARHIQRASDLQHNPHTALLSLPPLPRTEFENNFNSRGGGLRRLLSTVPGTTMLANDCHFGYERFGQDRWHEGKMGLTALSIRMKVKYWPIKIAMRR
jgi:hypothetical protein